MRADRLLSILMLLQARGRLTAGELARELEVSERTIYRDVDALSASGVPIYGDRGPDGGYALLDSYRTSLTGLTEREVRALFMLSIPAPLADLGVDGELRTALHKLAAALPDARRGDEERVRRRIHLDAVWWSREHEPVPYLAAIHEAVWQDRRLSIRYRQAFGVPAVIGWMSQVTDQEAVHFARVFFSALADGLPLDQAVTEARKSLFGSFGVESPGWGAVALSMRTPDTVLFQPPREESIAQVPPERDGGLIYSGGGAVGGVSRRGWLGRVGWAGQHAGRSRESRDEGLGGCGRGRLLAEQPSERAPQEHCAQQQPCQEGQISPAHTYTLPSIRHVL